MAQTLYNDIAAAEAAIDESCKRLLADKQILARIMHYCVDEFKGIDPKEIAKRYIEGTPDIGSVGVLPEQTNRKIHGLPNDDASVNEHSVRYDIRFSALAPDGSGGLIKLIINIEAQNKYHNSYPLITRGIYYLSRMISAQYGTEFDHSHYERIKKVYSIWICTDPPKSRVNTVTQYKMSEIPVMGKVAENPRHYDLMSAIIVCLGSESESSEGVCKLLELLLTDSKQTDTRCGELEDDFGIEISNEFERKVDGVCNVGHGIFEKRLRDEVNKRMDEINAEAARRINEINKRMNEVSVKHQEEIQETRREAENTTRTNTEFNIILTLMNNQHKSLDEVADMLNLPDDRRQLYRSMLDGST